MSVASKPKAHSSATQVGMLLLALTAGTAVPAQPQELDLCAVMPLADVSAILQSKLGGAGTVTTAQPGAGGMCSYRGEIDGRRTVRLLIDFTDYGSRARAREAQARLRQMMRERAMAVEEITGLGDEAFASREGETVGVKVRTRRYGGQVNLDVEEASFEAVKAAATLLAQKVVERLP